MTRWRWHGGAVAVAQHWLGPNDASGRMLAGVRCPWLKSGHCAAAVAQWPWPKSGHVRSGQTAVAVAESCQEQHSNSSGATFGAISGMLQIGGVSGNCIVGAKDTAVADWVVHVAHGQPKGCAGVREREAY